MYVSVYMLNTFSVYIQHIKQHICIYWILFSVYIECIKHLCSAYTFSVYISTFIEYIQHTDSTYTSVYMYMLNTMLNVYMATNCLSHIGLKNDIWSHLSLAYIDNLCLCDVIDDCIIMWVHVQNCIASPWSVLLSMWRIDQLVLLLPEWPYHVQHFCHMWYRGYGWIGLSLGWLIIPMRDGGGRCLTRLINHSPGIRGRIAQWWGWIGVSVGYLITLLWMGEGIPRVGRCLTRSVKHPLGKGTLI